MYSLSKSKKMLRAGYIEGCRKILEEAGYRTDFLRGMWISYLDNRRVCVMLFSILPFSCAELRGARRVSGLSPAPFWGQRDLPLSEFCMGSSSEMNPQKKHIYNS